jgi:hypothetical protein
MQGALKTGITPSESTNFGYAVFSQSTTATTTSDGLAVSATLTLQAGSQIISYFVDTVQDEAVGGGTMTTIPITVGIAAAGTEYMSSTNMVAGGRAAPTLTTAQLAAMADIGSNTSVVMTVDPNGTILTTQGIYRLTVIYSPKS